MFIELKLLQLSILKIIFVFFSLLMLSGRQEKKKLMTLVCFFKHHLKRRNGESSVGEQTVSPSPLTLITREQKWVALQCDLVQNFQTITELKNYGVEAANICFLTLVSTSGHGTTNLILSEQQYNSVFKEYPEYRNNLKRVKVN